MRGTHRTGVIPTAWSLLVLLGAWACSEPPETVPVPGREGAVKIAAALRAERRAYDGAPPVIAHQDFGIDCTACHDLEGMEVEDVGFAPPSPHEGTLGLSAVSNCRQCHVFSQTGERFVASAFTGLRQDLRSGGRLHPLAPPTLPHKVFMRENCAACHSGPAAREEVRTSHPKRQNCRQCHLEVRARGEFVSDQAVVRDSHDAYQR